MSNVAFTVVENAETDFVAVQIKEGEFSDIIYHYGYIGVEEGEKEGESRIAMTYNVLRSKDGIDLSDEETENRFYEVIGGILVQLMNSASRGEKNGIALAEISPDPETE